MQVSWHEAAATGTANRLVHIPLSKLLRECGIEVLSKPFACGLVHVAILVKVTELLGHNVNEV